MDLPDDFDCLTGCLEAAKKGHADVQRARQLGIDRAQDTEFIERLRQHATDAVHDVQAQEPVLRQRGIPVLFKPFDLDDLLRTIRRILGEETES